MAAVELRAVTKDYGGHSVIKGVDLVVEDKEFVVFVGPSGCGKSTLLRMIAGLEEISGGDLVIDGVRSNDVPPDRRGLAMVFQSYALYPHMSVADNMAFALRLAKTPKEEKERRVKEAARILQLEALLDRKPKALSGGQRQRVAIGRAIVRAPKVFLFDEPLSNLDAALRSATRLELAKLHKQLDATMIYVTHDQVEAMTMADRIVVLNGGYIEQVGTPLELYRNPRNLFVAGFIGSPKMNLLPGKVAGVEAGRARVTLADGAEVGARVADGAVAAGDAVTVGFRPEHVTLADVGVPGTVSVVEHLGGEALIYVDLGGGTLVTVKTDGDRDYETGVKTRLAIRDDAVLLFDADGKAVARGAAPSPLH